MEAVVTLDSRDKYEKMLIESIRKAPGGEIPSVILGIAFHTRNFNEVSKQCRDDRKTYEIVTFTLQTR